MATEMRSLPHAAEIDALFDGIEQIYQNDVIDERALIEPTIERWRWDEPAIGISWIDLAHDSISKNLLCRALGDHAPFHFTVEINAWLDSDVAPVGIGRVRHWRHEVVAEDVRVNPHADKLRGVIIAAFNRASELTQRDLTETEALT